MNPNSSIEWTEVTWNPVTGCDKVSPGCKNCYADRHAARLQRMHNPRYQRGFELTLHPDLVELPKTWKKPRVIFVNSMSDLFHEDIPLDFLQRVFATMVATPWHTYQILTKRSEHLRLLAPLLPWPANIWMGVSVENSDYTPRIDDLRTVPAAIRFISAEPLLGPLDNLNLEGISWLIAGGESGPNARPMAADWVRSLLQQCQASGTRYFFKQWGGVRKDKTGRELDGVIYDEYPCTSPAVPVSRS